jgi:hypothetical protein
MPKAVQIHVTTGAFHAPAIFMNAFKCKRNMDLIYFCACDYFPFFVKTYRGYIISFIFYLFLQEKLRNEKFDTNFGRFSLSANG